MPINNITQTISTIPPAGARGVDVQTIFVIKQEDFQDHLQGTTVTELNTLKDQLNTRIGEINSTATTMNGYADTASAGASTATTKAGEASTSASGALTSRNQAETFKNNASTSASTATTKASEASASALSASTSASTATTKASEASASALSVSTSASTATTKAGEASASASQALTSRNQAETFAQQAQASAESVDANNIVYRTGAETIDDIKTFTSSPIVPTPTTSTQAANKAYVDSASGDIVPAGTIITFASATAPTGYLKANGALVSRTVYSALFVAIGTTFGIGDGSTTFALPNLRGYFARGWDDDRGIDTGRVFGSNQGDSYLNHSHTASETSAGAHTHKTSVGDAVGAYDFGTNISDAAATSGTRESWADTNSAGEHTHTVTVAASTTGTTETRPKNIALLYCIKY